jgi:hypothetical protein
MMENSGPSGDIVKLVENEDYYMENGLMVLTARYLLRRGYCCEQGCRHCPYPESANESSQRDPDRSEETS